VERHDDRIRGWGNTGRLGDAASAPPTEVAAVAAGYGTIGLLSGLLIDVVNKQTIPSYIHGAQSRSSRIRLAPLYSSGASVFNSSLRTEPPPSRTTRTI
jgi:hypothetical protein